MPKRTPTTARRSVSALAAALVLLCAMPAAALPMLPLCGDVNASSSVTSSDALLVLKKGVGQAVKLDCSAYDNVNATCQAALQATSDELAACEAAPVGLVHRTGITQCTDEKGNQVSCAGTGQDGEFQAGTKNSFIDNGDGTVTDNLTGLTWEKLSNDDSLHDRDDAYTWTDAMQVKVAKLNDGSGFADHTDWRVPNRRELETLVDLSAQIPATFPEFDGSCSPGCDIGACSCTPHEPFWTSSPYPDTLFAWAVDFYDGNIPSLAKGEKHHVRAVRGGL